MRRQPKYRFSTFVGYLAAEVERIKAQLGYISDGRGLVYTDTGPGGGGGGGGGAPAAAHVLYGSKHSKSLRVTAGAGLSVDYEEGHVRIDETYYLVAAGNLAGLTDDTTNYVFVNNSGTVAKNATGFPDNCVPLAEVVTVGGSVSTVTDKRAYLYGHHGPSFAGTVSVDTIDEYTGAAGVTIEGNLLKDGAVHPTADATFYLKIVTGDPNIVFDTDDFIYYDRASDLYHWKIGDAIILRASATGFGYIGGDANFGFSVSGNNRLLGFDVNDAFYYEQASNYFGFVIAGAECARIDAASVKFNVGLNPDFYAYTDAGQSVLSMDGGTDQLKYDRTSNYFSFLIGNVEKARVDSAGQLQLPVTGASAGLLVGGDALLYRSAADRLQLGDGDDIRINTGAGDFIELRATATSAWLYGVGSDASDWYFGAYVSGDTNPRLLCLSSGALTWGPGNAGGDVNLYRGAANILATDDSFELAIDLQLKAVAADPGYVDGKAIIYFYSSGGTDELRVRGKIGATETQVTLADLSP